jgi:hypothetical protein
MAEILNYATNYKNVTVKISDGTTITGKINILDYPRLSDLLRQTNNKFITVLIEDNDEGTKRAIIINKEHIIWAETQDPGEVKCNSPFEQTRTSGT